MKNRKTDNYFQREQMFNRYLIKAGHNLLTEKANYRVPVGWINIVVELFKRVRQYHPNLKIESMIIVEPSHSYGSKFFFAYIAPDKQRYDDLLHKPRSLRWIERQARRQVYATCSRCGRPLKGPSKKNRCLVCARKDGFKSFN